jgi:hypothetical protein
MYHPKVQPVIERGVHAHAAEEVVVAVPFDADNLMRHIALMQERLDEAMHELAKAQDGAIDFFESLEEHQAFLERIRTDPAKVLASDEKPFVKKIAMAYLKCANAQEDYDLAQEAFADKDMTVGQLKAEFRKELKKMELKVAKLEEEKQVDREMLKMLFIILRDGNIDKMLEESRKPDYSAKVLQFLLSDIGYEFGDKYNCHACNVHDGSGGWMHRPRPHAVCNYLPGQETEDSRRRQRYSSSHEKQEVLNEHIRRKGGCPIVW